VNSLNGGGTLVLHDTFPASETPAPPEVVLPPFNRHVLSGGSRNWPLARLRSALTTLGLQLSGADPVAGGTHLVTARKL